MTPLDEYERAALTIAGRGGVGTVHVSNRCAAEIQRDPYRFARLVERYVRQLERPAYATRAA